MRIRTRKPIAVGSWVHVAVTNDGSSQASGLKIFVNGALSETEVVRDNLTKNITGGGGDQISIGERFRDNGFKNGRVDELRVFDIELTDLEALSFSKHNESLPWSSLRSKGRTRKQDQLVANHYSIRHSAETTTKRKLLQMPASIFAKRKIRHSTSW